MPTKIYKLHSDSTFAVSGTWRDGMYEVNLPVDEIDPSLEWFLDVQTFFINDAFEGAPYMVVLPTVNFRNSVYTNTTKNVSNIMLLTYQAEYQKQIDTNVMSNRITTPMQFKGTMIRVQIVDPTTGLTTTLGTTNNWSMILVLYAK